MFKSCSVAPGKTGAEESYGVNNQDFVRVLTREAVKAGAELKTTTTVIDVIRQGDIIKGVKTEGGEEIKANTKMTIAEPTSLYAQSWPSGHKRTLAGLTGCFGKVAFIGKSGMKAEGKPPMGPRLLIRP